MYIKNLFEKFLLAEREEFAIYCNRPFLSWLSRILLMCLGCSIFGFSLNDPFFFFWSAVFTCILLLDFWRARRFIQNQSLPNFVLCKISDTADVAWSFCLFFWMWTYGTMALGTASMVFLSGSFLHSMTGRIRFPSFVVTDAIYAQLAFGSAWIWLLVSHRLIGPDYALIVALFAGQVFHFLTIREIGLNLAQIEIAKRRSQEAQRMEAVGRLTGGISHDFNNILTVILGNLDLYEEIPSREERSHLVAEARKAAQRASALTAQLLAFSRRVPMDVQPLVVSEFLASIEQIILRSLPASSQYRLVDSAPDAVVRADANHLSAALLNLLINARDALEGKAGLVLEISRVSTESNPFLDLPAGHYISFAVKDFGHGIPAEDLPKIFEPYFTTKPIGEGSGLGLSMVKGFAEQSKGIALARNHPDGGAIVEIILPEDI